MPKPNSVRIKPADVFEAKLSKLPSTKKAILNRVRAQEAEGEYSPEALEDDELLMSTDRVYGSQD